jgi:peptidoglycan hydrolase-like protein with peptidoglycan-binding domain
MTTRKQSRGRRPALIGTSLTTVAGLFATAAPAAPLLARGTSGPAVSQVQRALHTTVNGRFGSATRHAVLDFQRLDGLLVDGVVGPQTWERLFGITPPKTNSSSSPTAAAPASAPSSSTAGYTIPSGIVSCESGGNYSAVNPSSGAGGAYQILPSTWHAYGGQGLPQDASPAEQGRIAAQIYAAQGASAWSC